MANESYQVGAKISRQEVEILDKLAGDGKLYPSVSEAIRAAIRLLGERHGVVPQAEAMT